MAILHHQIIHRLQNHGMNLKNQGIKDALMVLAEPGAEIPTIMQISKQIARKKLEQLVPIEWITNYELLHNETEPIKSIDFEFETLKDGRVKTVYTTDTQANSSIPEFQLMIMSEKKPRRKDPLISSFNSPALHR